MSQLPVLSVSLIFKKVDIDPSLHADAHRHRTTCMATTSVIMFSTTNVLDDADIKYDALDYYYSHMSAEQDIKLYVYCITVCLVQENRDTPTSALFASTRYVTCDCGNTK